MTDSCQYKQGGPLFRRLSVFFGSDTIESVDNWPTLSVPPLIRPLLLSGSVEPLMWAIDTIDLYCQWVLFGCVGLFEKCMDRQKLKLRFNSRDL